MMSSKPLLSLVMFVTHFELIMFEIFWEFQKNIIHTNHQLQDLLMQKYYLPSLIGQGFFVRLDLR